MTQGNRTRTWLAVAALAALAAGTPQAAQARGRGGPRGPAFVAGGGFYGFYPYYGLGFGPFFGPYFGSPFYYTPPGGIDMSAAFVAGWGAVDLNVKPGQAEVWVDGKYVNEAQELDGYPSYLWLPEGAHRVVIYKGGYGRFEEDIEVQRGFRKDLKVRLEKGQAEPPGQKPKTTS